VIVYGLGGIYTEVFKMVDFLLLPLTQEEIEKSLRESKIKFLFEETRGQKPYNISEVAGIIFGLSFLAQEIVEITEFDMNPLMIYNNGQAVSAVDVKVIL
jgi:acetyltransferase